MSVDRQDSTVPGPRNACPELGSGWPRGSGVYSVSPPAAAPAACWAASFVVMAEPSRGGPLAAHALLPGPAVPMCSRSRPCRDRHILRQMRPSVEWKRPELFISGHRPKSEADKWRTHRACALGGWLPPAELRNPRFTYMCEPLSCYLC